MRALSFLAIAFGFAAELIAPADSSVPPVPSMREVLTATYAVRELNDVELAGDAKAVAWEEDFRDPRRLLRSAHYSAVYIKRIDGGESVQITAGGTSGYYEEKNPTWSPDGRQVAFLSDARSKGQRQIFVADSDGARVHQIGMLVGDVAHLTWAPTGKTLAFLYISGAHREAGALAPGARDVGVIGTTFDEQRLATIDVVDGALHFLTPRDTYVYEYGWSPDGQQIALTYAKGNGDDNWWIARLARVNVETRAMHDLLVPAFQINDPQWSPDGKQIAIVGGIMSDFGSTGGDVYLVNAANGSSRDVTERAPISVQSLRWNDASSIDLVAHVTGTMRLMRLDIASARLRTLTNREESLWSWSSARSGAIVALVRASFADPPEIWAGPPSALRQVSASNASAIRLYGKSVSLKWPSDQLTIQGWLIYPRDFNPHAS